MNQASTVPSATGDVPIGWAPVVYLLGLLAFERLNVRASWLSWCERHPRALAWVILALAVVLILTFAGASSPEFIYFQF